MEAVAENKNKYHALGINLLFHAILILIFILVVFVTPIPPFEIKTVTEIEIGFTTCYQNSGCTYTQSGKSGD